jgi:hypothetical protein
MNEPAMGQEVKFEGGATSAITSRLCEQLHGTEMKSGKEGGTASHGHVASSATASWDEDEVPSKAALSIRSRSRTSAASKMSLLTTTGCVKPKPSRRARAAALDDIVYRHQGVERGVFWLHCDHVGDSTNVTWRWVFLLLLLLLRRLALN